MSLEVILLFAGLIVLTIVGSSVDKIGRKLDNNQANIDAQHDVLQGEIAKYARALIECENDNRKLKADMENFMRVCSRRLLDHDLHDHVSCCDE